MAYATSEKASPPSATESRPARVDGRASRRLRLVWLPIVPFFLYVGIFLLLPTAWLVIGAFQSDSGGVTLSNIRALFQSESLDAYKTSLEISAATALTGGIFGFFVAYAMVKEQGPRWLRPLLSTFAGVAANFAGVPLAFAFAATLGTTGVITVFLKNFGIEIYQNGFTIYSFLGVVLVYTYFQMPLMLLVISPALDGLRGEWREAATNLGATPAQFWRWVGLPILWPALFGAVVLLFGSAFAAYATAYALVGSQFNLVPLIIGRDLSSDFIGSPGQANALAFGMIVIISGVMLVYALLQRRSSRWMR
jgi:putative spermidine/putrescine transport system permease protein